MYLKRLEIQGFKSFANKTVLDFLPPRGGRFSITAIVGPNGAGKSNISDAIRWVMGETSLKNLRGKKSEDVIFNGSTTKGQMGMSEVSLVLDNEGGKVMGDYPEIVVTRRLYRSGETEYLINNSQARLFDIHLLLAKAQFAQHSYGIIGQGTIDRLLTVGPAERRDFLDEASGIKEFQIKQHQASLKLERTKENMTQAERLIAEVEPRLRLLSRQVRKLEKRQEVETQLREVEEKYYATIYTRNQSELNRLSGDLQKVEEEYRATFKELETVQGELADFARSASRQEVFVALQSKHQQAVREKNEWERQLAILQGQMQTGYTQAGKQNVGWLESKVAESRAAKDQLSQEFGLAQQETARLEELSQQQRRLQENVAMARAEKNVKISQLQSLLWQSQSEQSYLQLSGFSAVKAVLEEKHRFGRVYGLVAELGEVEEVYRLALEVAATAHLSSVVVDSEETAKAAIEFLRERRLGVATFLPVSKIKGRSSAPEGEDLLREEGVIGRAIDLIKFDNKFNEIFSYVFGETLVVKDLATATRLGVGKMRMVTLAGDLLEKSGAMKGGWRGKRQGALGFSGQLSLSGEDKQKEYEASLETAREELQLLEKQASAASSKLMDLEVQVKTSAAKSEMLRERQQKLEMEMAALVKELSMLQTSPEQYGEMLSGLAMQKEQIIKQIAGSENKISALLGEVEEFNRKEEEKKQRVFALQEKMQKRQQDLNTVLGRRNDLKIELAKWETKQEDLSEEAASNLNVSVASIMERAPQTVPLEQLDELVAQIQKLKYQLSLIGGIDEDVTKEHQETKERYDFLTGQLDDLKAATDDLEKMIAELDDVMKKKRAAAFKKIRQEFSRFFKILFNGGNASLEEIYGEPEPDEDSLVQGENPAGEGMSPSYQPAYRQAGRGEGGVAEEEIRPAKIKEKILTGIDIMVNPPGKKIKNISALSGGERTLTSIALICAILNCNPSPFVVLDEVEAALDEANTLRFAEIMAELTVQSQFVIITHNRVTMHAADALYGVVMGGDGVSKLLSVKVEDVPPGATVDPVKSS